MDDKTPDLQWLDEIMKLNENEQKMTDKQIKIIASAVEIFAVKGYSAASTSEIAQKAGVAEGTIFRHYKTKKDLLLSIVGPIMTKMIAPLFIKDFTKKIMHTNYDHFEDFLRAVIVNRMEFVRKNLPIIKIMLHEIPFHPELKSQFIDEVTSNMINQLTNIIKHYQQEGQIIQLPSKSVIRLCLSTILGFILTRYLLLPEHEWDDEREISVTINFIMHGLSAIQVDTSSPSV